MKCPVQGDGRQPVYFRWFKGEDELSEDDTDHKFAGAENKKLTVRRVSPETEGSYRCRGINGFGSQEFTFIVQLRRKSRKNSRKVPGVLKNQTVLKGSPLKLNCRVSTEEMFPVKWLKKVVTDEITEAKAQLSYIQLGADKYKVFQSSQSSEFLLSEKFIPQDASYQHSLSFLSAGVSDSGQYVCLVYATDPEEKLLPLANQTAYVEVISPTHSSALLSPPPPPHNSGGSPVVSSVTIVLAVLGSVVLILLLILAVLLLKPKVSKPGKHAVTPENSIGRDDAIDYKGDKQPDLEAHNKLIKTADEEAVCRREPAVSWVWRSQAVPKQEQHSDGQDTIIKQISDKGNNTFLEFV